MAGSSDPSQSLQGCDAARLLITTVVLQDAVASLYGAFPLEGFSQADVRQLGLDDGTLADDFLLAADSQHQQPSALGLPTGATSPADSPFVFGRNSAASGAASAPQFQHQVGGCQE